VDPRGWKQAALDLEALILAQKFEGQAPSGEAASGPANEDASAAVQTERNGGVESARPAAGSAAGEPEDSTPQSAATVVDAWQHDAARLNPSAAPVQGFFLGEWSRTCGIIKAFLARRTRCAPRNAAGLARNWRE
jgi:hypothetical protein